MLSQQTDDTGVEGNSSNGLSRRRSTGSLVNFLNFEEPEGASGLSVEPRVVETGTGLRVLRISFRLLLLYIQQAPLDIATKVALNTNFV